MNSNIESRYQSLIDSIQSELCSETFRRAHCENKQDFTRQRILTFVCVILFLLNMVKRSLQDELDCFFQAMLGRSTPVREVSKSAFTQARKKLNYTAFVALNRTQTDHFYDHFEIRKWNGFRLLTIDGSMADLPNLPDIQDHFGVWQPHSGGKCAKARLSQLFDPLNKITIDALIKPKEVGERAAAEEHFHFIGKGDLILMDRGYPAFWLFSLILSRGADFCARVEPLTWRSFSTFLDSGESEALIEIRPDPTRKKMCDERGLSSESLHLRLIRVELDSGDVELLVTSLTDLDHIPSEVFCDLYHQRWFVEEDFKVLKSRLEIENWSGKSVKSVYQDFHAAIFTKNFAAMLAHASQDELDSVSASLTYRYQVNQTNLLSKLKYSIVSLFTALEIKPWLTALWEQMIRTREPIRPGRSSPRNFKVKRKRFSTTYKSIH